MSKRKYGNKEVLGDSQCPTCSLHGGDTTGNHLVHWRNTDNDEEWVACTRTGCGHYELITERNREVLEGVRNEVRELSEEEIAQAVAEVEELPTMALVSRGIRKDVAKRFGVKVGLSQTDGSTVVSHFYPKTKEGLVTGFKVRSLDPKYFYSVGDGRNSDLFGISQARKGDVYTGKLFITEDELSAMTVFQILVDNSKTTFKPAVVSLPNGASAAAASLGLNRSFVEGFSEIVICMDNDEAGESAVKVIRAIYPKVKIARVPKGKMTTNPDKDVKDPNDMLMDGRSIEMFNALRYTASVETPSGAVSVADCIEEALKKPEWGIPYPWAGLTAMTYGLIYGELISVGGGVGSGCE